MFVTDEQAEKRLANNPSFRSVPSSPSQEELDQTVTQKLHNERGREAEVPNLTPEARAAIGSLAHFIPAKIVSEEFGVSTTSISSFKNGRTGQGREDEDLKSEVEKRVGQVQEAAIDRVMTAMGLLTDEKIEEMNKPREIAAFARDMTSVYDKLRDRTPQIDRSRTAIIFYSPSRNEEKDYDVLEA